ncbi:MAG TPA: hypothetical protein VF645_06515 [Allosphingosinicella sp.]|jgi:hypothetical protein
MSEVMRLFHFSEDPSIAVFEPRPVRVPSPRAPGMEWLNGPLVWAIDDWHQPLYLFPRDCPRILIWPGPQTTAQDRAKWWGGRSSRMIAHVEAAWWDRLSTSSLCRYELPHGTFEPLNDAGMHVSRVAVEPLTVETVRSLPSRLTACDVEIEIVPSLVPLAEVWKSSMSASGIRLRNARDWPSA